MTRSTDLTKRSSGPAVTSVVTRLLVTAAVWAESTTATFSMSVVPFGNVASRRTTMVSVPVAPDGRAPRVQLTTLPDAVPPPLAETNVVRGGSASETNTAEASASPVLA